MEISKVIIPAAGLGTRFLPYSKSIAREMLPLLNKPAIQHVAEEALLSELANIIVVTSKGKDAIADHFDMSSINAYMKEHDKLGLLASI